MTPIEFIIAVVASTVSIAAAFSPPRRRHHGPIFLCDAIDDAEPIAVPPALITPREQPRAALLCAMPTCGAMTTNRISLIATDGSQALEIPICPECFALALRRVPLVAATLRAWATRIAVVHHEDTGATL